LRRRFRIKPETTIVLERENHQTDIVIIGGGSAGVSAAVAAGRLGKSVTLVERYPFLGGTATAAMVGPTATFHTKQGRQIVGGIPDEIVQALVKTGGSLGHVPDTIGVCGSVTPIEPELMKLMLLQFAKEAGVKMLFHALVNDVQKNKDQITSVTAVTKSGPLTIHGKVFVDASGDGDLAAAAGVPFSVGEAGSLPQPMTLIFKVGNVDIKETIKYMLANRDEFWHNTLFDQLESAPAIGVSGFTSLWKEAQSRGELDGIPRDRALFFSGVRNDEIVVNTTRVINKNALNPWELSQAEIEGRAQVDSLMKFFRKYIPGFRECYLAQVATQIGVRETRRIHGQYTLTAEDVVEGRSFDDGIAKCAWPIDIHHQGSGLTLSKDVGGSGSYDIPFRCLLPQGISNLLLAGRNISVSHEAFASSRIQATAMANGQAAGTAAALSLPQKGDVHRVSIPLLRETLVKRGAIL